MSKITKVVIIALAIFFTTSIVNMAYGEGYPSDNPNYDAVDYGNYLDQLIEDYLDDGEITPDEQKALEDKYPNYTEPEDRPDDAYTFPPCEDCENEYDEWKHIQEIWDEWWDKKKKDNTDPLIFSMTGEPEVTRAYPEMHPTRLTTVTDYNSGNQETLSRIIHEGTYAFGMDFNKNGVLDTDREYLMGSTNVYYFLNMIDSNRNGFYDYADAGWEYVLIKNGDDYYTPEQLGILGIEHQDYTKSMSDMHGERQYSDCLYQGEYHYPDCVVASTNHFPVMAWNDDSVIMKGGQTVDSFSLVMGYLK